MLLEIWIVIQSRFQRHLLHYGPATCWFIAWKQKEQRLNCGIAADVSAVSIHPEPDDKSGVGIHQLHFFATLLCALCAGFWVPRSSYDLSFSTWWSAGNFVVELIVKLRQSDIRLGKVVGTDFFPRANSSCLSALREGGGKMKTREQMSFSYYFHLFSQNHSVKFPIQQGIGTFQWWFTMDLPHQPGVSSDIRVAGNIQGFPDQGAVAPETRDLTWGWITEDHGTLFIKLLFWRPLFFTIFWQILYQGTR